MLCAGGSAILPAALHSSAGCSRQQISAVVVARDICTGRPFVVSYHRGARCSGIDTEQPRTPEALVGLFALLFRMRMCVFGQRA